MLSALPPAQDQDYEEQCTRARSLSAGLISRSKQPLPQSQDDVEMRNHNSNTASASVSISGSVSAPALISSSVPAMLLDEEDSYVAVQDDDDGVMSICTTMADTCADDNEIEIDDGDDVDEDDASMMLLEEPEQGQDNIISSTKDNEEKSIVVDTPMTVESTPMVVVDDTNTNSIDIDIPIDDQSQSCEERHSAARDSKNDVTSTTEYSNMTDNLLPVVPINTSGQSISQYHDNVVQDDEHAHENASTRVTTTSAPTPDATITSTTTGSNEDNTNTNDSNDNIDNNAGASTEDKAVQAPALKSTVLLLDLVGPTAPPSSEPAILNDDDINTTTVVPASEVNGDNNDAVVDNAIANIASNNEAGAETTEEAMAMEALFPDEEEEEESNGSNLAITTASMPVAKEADELSATVTAPAVTPTSSPHNLGLTNLGNTCYMNSALQMLFSQHQFISDLYKYDASVKVALERLVCEEEAAQKEKSEACAETDTETKTELPTKDDKKKSLRQGFLALVKDMKLCPDIFGDVDTSASTLSAVNPCSFKTSMDGLCCLFEGYQQQDSHEYLSTVLDMLHDEILAEQKQMSKRRKQLLPEVEVAPEAAVDATPTEEGTTAIAAPIEDSEEEKESLAAMNEESKDEDNVALAAAISVDAEVDVRVRTATEEMPLKRAHVELEEVTPAQGESKPLPKQACAAAENKPLTIARRASSFAELNTSGISWLLHDNSDTAASNSSMQKGHAKIARTKSEPHTASMGMSMNMPTQQPLLLGGRLAAPTTPSHEGKSSTGKKRSVWGFCSPASAILDVVGAPEDDEAEEIHVTPDMDFIPQPEAGPEESTTNNEDVADTSNVAQSEAEDNAEAKQKNAEEEEEEEDVYSPVETHFGAKVEVCLTCNSCKYTRTKTELYRYFSLDLTGSAASASSIDEGLKHFFKPETIDLKCEKCFSSQATETKEIVRLPKTLLLHFKRFIIEWDKVNSCVKYEKNQSRVEFGREVDLQDYFSVPRIHDDNENEDAKATSDEDQDTKMTMSVCQHYEQEPAPQSFQLKSIVHHHGSTASCGHYTADGLRNLPLSSETDADADPATTGASAPKTRWMHFNDSYVTSMENTPDKLLDASNQSSAYMVLYERLE